MQSQKIYSFNVQSVVGLLLGTFGSNTVQQSTRLIEEFSECFQFIGCILDIVKERKIDKRIKQAALITISNIIKKHNTKSDIIEVQSPTSQQQKNNNSKIIKTIKQNIISIAYSCTEYLLIPLIANIIVELTKNISKIQLKEIVQQISTYASDNNQETNYRQFVFYSIIQAMVQLYNSSITEFYKSIIIVSLTFAQMISTLTVDVQKIRQSIQLNHNVQISMILRNINCGLRVIQLIFNKLNKLYEIIKNYIHQLLLILLYFLDHIEMIIVHFNQQLYNSNTNSEKTDQCTELLHFNLNIIYKFYQFCYHYGTNIKEQSIIDQNAQTLSRIIQSQYSKLVIVNIGRIILSDISLHIHISNQINLCNDITKCIYWITQVHAQTKSLILSNSVNILMALLKNYTIDQCDRQLCEVSYRGEIDESRQGLLQLIGTFMEQQDNKIIGQQIIKVVSLQTNSNLQNIQLSMYIISRFQYKQINVHMQDIISKNIAPIIGLQVDLNFSQYPDLQGLLKIRACEIVLKYMNWIEEIGAISLIQQLFLSNTLVILNQILIKNNFSNNLLPVLLSYTEVLLTNTKIMKQTEQMDKISFYKQLIVKLINILPLLEHSDSYNCVLDTLEQFLQCLHYECIRQILGDVFNSIFHIYWAQIQQLHEQIMDTSQKNSKLIDRDVEKDAKVVHEQCNDILTAILHLILNQSKNNKNNVQISNNIKWIVQLVNILSSQERIQIVKQCGQVQSYTLLFNQAVYLLLLDCIYNGNANNVKLLDVHHIIDLCFDVIKVEDESSNNVEQERVQQMQESTFRQGNGQDNGLGQQFIFDGMEQQTQNKIITLKPISHKLISTILSTISNTILLNYLIQKQSSLPHKSIELSSSFKQIILCKNKLTFKSFINVNYTYQQKKICMDTVKLFIWSQIFSHQIVCSLYEWALEQLLLYNSKKPEIQQYYLPVVYLSVIRYKDVISDMQKLCKVLLNNIRTDCQANNSTKYHQKWLIQCSFVAIKMIFSSNFEQSKGNAIKIVNNIEKILSNRIDNSTKSIQVHDELYTMNMSPTKKINNIKNTNYFTSQILQSIIIQDKALNKYFTETLLQIKHILSNYQV